MAFFEERMIQDTILIETTPERIFSYLTGIVDDDTYRAWHPEDHVRFQWLKGDPWKEDSIMVAEEYLHGKLHKFKFQITRIEPNRRIEYAPVSPLLRKFLPKNEFLIDQENGSCRFTATGTYRVGWIGKKLFMNAIEKGLESVRKHMQEEGENLKKILECEICSGELLSATNPRGGRV